MYLICTFIQIEEIEVQKGEILKHNETYCQPSKAEVSKTKNFVLMASNLRIDKFCQYCGNRFVAKTTVTKYCGDNCAKRAYKERKKAEKIESTNKVFLHKAKLSIQELQTKDFLSVQEFCQLFQVSRTTAWRLMKDGKVDAARIGRKKFITRASIDALFNPPIEIQPKESEPKELNIEDCWNIGEVEKLFALHSKTLYDAILRFDIPKMQKGKFVYVPKDNIISIFGEPK